MRLIDADVLFDKIGKIKPRNKEHYKSIGEFMNLITNSPTIDAVKVVRCQECEYWKCNPNTNNYGVCGKVSYDDFEVIMERNDFCSYPYTLTRIRNKESDGE